MNMTSITDRLRQKIEVIALPGAGNPVFEIFFTGTPSQIVLHNLELGLKGMGWTVEDAGKLDDETTIWNIILPFGEVVMSETIDHANRIIDQAFGIRRP